MQWPGPGLALTGDEDTPGHPLRGEQHPVRPVVWHGRLLLLRHRPRQWPQPLGVQPPRGGRWPRGHTQPRPWPQSRPLQVSLVLWPLSATNLRRLLCSSACMFIHIPCLCQQLSCQTVIASGSGQSYVISSGAHLTVSLSGISTGRIMLKSLTSHPAMQIFSGPLFLFKLWW